MVQDIKMWPSGDGGLIPRMRHVGSGASDPNVDLNILGGSQLSWESDQGQLFSITNELQSGVIFSVNDISGLSHLSVNASGEVDVGEYSSKITMHKAVNQPIANAEAEPENAVVDIDLSKGNYFEVTLGAAVTDVDFTNGQDGQRFVVRFEQPAGANYAIAWTAVTHDQDGGGSPAAVTMRWAGGTTPTMTATNGKADTYGFIVRDENKFDGYVIGQNI
tara:strand:- start:14766 stop:15422 length:657 start_codon:yes stop_codon:yes gene_type:complete